VCFCVSRFWRPAQHLTDAAAKEQVMPFYRRKPQRGQIMPKTNSLLPVATVAVATTSRPAPTLPETGFLRQQQVLAFVPISKSTLWRRIQEKTFPKPLKLSPRVTVWRAEDIRKWILLQAVETA
jgi:predicted DNA-binding transcriptional regulator AlpA